MIEASLLQTSIFERALPVLGGLSAIIVISVNSAGQVPVGSLTVYVYTPKGSTLFPKLSAALKIPVIGFPP